MVSGARLVNDTLPINCFFRPVTPCAPAPEHGDVGEDAEHAETDSEQGQKFMCDFCLRQFTVVKYLNAHRNSEHASELAARALDLRVRETANPLVEVAVDAVQHARQEDVQRRQASNNMLRGHGGSTGKGPGSRGAHVRSQWTYKHKVRFGVYYSQ